MKRILIISALILGFHLSLFSQLKTPPSLPNRQSVSVIKSIPLQVPGTVLDGDTVAMFDLSTVNVISMRSFASAEEQIKYYRLMYNVKVAYPYAVLAGATFKECEARMQTMTSRSEKKHYLKQVEQQMKDEYKKDLENLTEEQGRILIKLIDRETGTTSYDMVKEIKGSLNAFMWQTVARLFGNSLKDTYDPENEDKDMESIVQLINMGQI